MLKTIVLDGKILILMEKIVNFKLSFWQNDLFSTELIFEFD